MIEKEGRDMAKERVLGDDEIIREGDWVYNKKRGKEHPKLSIGKTVKEAKKYYPSCKDILYKVTRPQGGEEMVEFKVGDRVRALEDGAKYWKNAKGIILEEKALYEETYPRAKGKKEIGDIKLRMK